MAEHPPVPSAPAPATRIEKDFLGEREIPADAYYGVQTQRGRDNFHITGIPMSLEPCFVRAFGYVKKAAALANRDLGVLDAKVADAVAAACDKTSHCSAMRSLGKACAIAVTSPSSSWLPMRRPR